MARKKRKKKKGKPFKRKLVATVGDLLERSMQKGLTESHAWASLNRLESGNFQTLNVARSVDAKN
jgi:hypothetical protein